MTSFLSAVQRWVDVQQSHRVTDAQTPQSPSCVSAVFTRTFRSGSLHSGYDMRQACNKVVRSAFAFFNVSRLPLLRLWKSASLVLKFWWKKATTQKQCSRSAGVCYFLGRGTASGRQSRHHRRWMRLLLILNVQANFYFHSHAVST